MLGGLGAVPWAALAAIAVPMIIDALDDGPAERTGVFASGSSALGGNPKFRGSGAFGAYGIVNDQWFSDEEMAGPLGAVMQTIAGLDDAISQIVGDAKTGQIASALAGHSASFSFGTEHESIGDVAGSILKDRYMVVLSAIDSRLADILSGFEGSADEMAAFVVSLVQFDDATKKLPAAVRDNLIRALDGTTAALQKAGKWAQAYAVVLDVANSDPRELASDRIRSQQSPARFAFDTARESLADLIDEFDGSADSAIALSGGLANLQGSLVDLIVAADQARQSIDDVFSGAATDILLDTMTPAQKEQFYRDDNTRLLGLIAQSDDPAQIERWGQQIAGNYSAMWGLIPDGPGRQAIAPSYIANLQATQEIIDQRLIDIGDVAENTANTMIDGVRGMLEDAIDQLGQVATDMQTAADTMLDAARTPVTVVVEMAAPGEAMVTGG